MRQRCHASVRGGGDFAMRKAPDATTPLKFRHILKDYEIGEKIFTEVCDRLNRAGLVMYGSTIVDASISTFRRPRRTQQMKGSNMHQSKKGNERRFGMKMRTVTDAGTIYARTITGTAAFEHDSQPAHKPVRGEMMSGDSGCLDVGNQEGVRQLSRLSQVECCINKRSTSVKKKGDGSVNFTRPSTAATKSAYGSLNFK